MTDMIERVARAICESELMNPDDALGGWIHWQDAARAAIEAMREPILEMQQAAWNRDATRRPLQTEWSAMIDAALGRGGE